jgi:hypothetical protein
MRRKELISFLFKVILLGLAILLIIFGLYPKLLNGENQEMYFESPLDKSMPEEGYVTHVYDPLTYVTVDVKSRGEDVEVHLYVSTYRGGKVIEDSNGTQLLRDEWLAAGEKEERIGRNIELNDFTAYSASYVIRVVVPDGSIPSEADYDITVKAYTVNMSLIIAGLIFYAIFIFLGIFEYLSTISRTLKSGVPMGADAAAEASDLEALLEPGAAAPAAAMIAVPAPEVPMAPAATSYEAMVAQQPLEAAAVPAPLAPMAPPPALEAPAPYAPPPPPDLPPPPAVAPAAPAYQVPAPPAAPVAAPPPVAMAPAAPAPPPVAAAPAPAPAAVAEPVSKVRCPSCKNIVPVYTHERPTPIECPTCGKKGMIR